jgi:hypothetical protein
MMSDRPKRSSVILTAKQLVRILIYSDCVIMGSGLNRAVPGMCLRPIQDGVMQPQWLR